MKCPKCQTENPATRKFCRECGAKLLLVCPQCDTENLPEDKFCGECGQNFKKPKEAPPIDYFEPQSYTPKFLAEKILTTRSSIEGERKLVTVLFADVANFTSTSEVLDPEEVHQIMDGCFKILIDVIHKYEGTINQFTGDGVMALFGAPLAHEDHAQRACYAALSIQKALANYEEKIKNDFGAEFKMRIGLNSGPVIVGAIGDDLRMDYTAVGDTTNLASRIENLAGPGTCLVSSHTHRMVQDYFEFEALGKMEVKGKKGPQEIFELIKAGEVDTRIAASTAKGLTRFVGRERSIASLIDAYEKTQLGSGQVVGVVGEAGVGKSTLDGTKQFFTMLFTAFPDIHATIHDQVAEGDEVVTRKTFHGTHRGEFMGIVPTDKSVAVDVIDIFRVAGGKITDHWAVADMLGLMQQLGVVPSPDQPGE